MLSLTPKPWSNMVCQSYGTTGVRKNSLGEIVYVNKKTIVRLVYCTLVLDNILLTVVGKIKILLSNQNYANNHTWFSVPIIPVFLYQHALEKPSNKTDQDFDFLFEAIENSNEAKESKQQVLNFLHRIFQSSIHGPKLTHPAKMVSENGRVGALFSSKAFVQLLVNPLVGKATNKFGYELPFIIGTGFLFVSSFSKKTLHLLNFKFQN